MILRAKPPVFHTFYDLAAWWRCYVTEQVPVRRPRRRRTGTRL